MKGEPSWRTAVTEAESARRHVAQASEALERLAREVAALREWGDSMAAAGPGAAALRGGGRGRAGGARGRLVGRGVLARGVRGRRPTRCSRG